MTATAGRTSSDTERQTPRRRRPGLVVAGAGAVLVAALLAN
jgi:hypothetical protein